MFGRDHDLGWEVSQQVYLCYGC